MNLARSPSFDILADMIPNCTESTGIGPFPIPLNRGGDEGVAVEAASSPIIANESLWPHLGEM